MCPSVGPVLVVNFIPSTTATTTTTDTTGAPTPAHPSVWAVTPTVHTQDKDSDVTLRSGWNNEEDPDSTTHSTKKGHYAISFDGYCILDGVSSDILKCCSKKTTKHYIWKFIDCGDKTYAVYCTREITVENDPEKTVTVNMAWAATDDNDEKKSRVILKAIDITVAPTDEFKFVFLSVKDVMESIKPTSAPTSNLTSKGNPEGVAQFIPKDGGKTTKREN